MSQDHVSKRIDEGYSSDEYSDDFEDFDWDDIMPKRRNKVSQSKTSAPAAVTNKSVDEPTVPVKYVLNGSLRRANLARPLDINVLMQRVRESFGDSKPKRQFRLSYQDDEGDTITIATTEELTAAADCAQSAGRVLLVNANETSNVNESSNKDPGTPARAPAPAPALTTNSTATMATQESIADSQRAAAASLAAKKIQMAAQRQATRIEKMQARKAERVKQAHLRRERRAALAAEREARRALQASRARAAAAASTPLIPTSTARLDFEPMALVEIQQPTGVMYGRVINFNASLGKYLVMITGDDCGNSSRQLPSQHFAPHELTRLASQPTQNMHQQQPPVLAPPRATLFNVGPKPKVYRHPFLHSNGHQATAHCQPYPQNDYDHCKGRPRRFMCSLFAAIAAYLTLSCFFSGTMAVVGAIALVAVARRSKMMRRKTTLRRCSQRWRQQWSISYNRRFEYLAAIDTSEAMEILPFVQMAFLAIGFLSGTTLLPSLAWVTSIIAMIIKALRVSYAWRTGDEGIPVAPWAACICDKFTTTCQKINNSVLAFVRGPKNGARDRRQSFVVFAGCLATLLFVYVSLKFVTPIFWVAHFLGTRNGFRTCGPQQQQPISSSGPCTGEAQAAAAATAEQNEEQVVSSILAAIERAPPSLRASFSNQLFQALGKQKHGRVGRTRFNGVIQSLKAKGVTVV